MEDVAKITIDVLKAAIIRILGIMPADFTAPAGDAAPPGELRHPPSLRDEIQVDEPSLGGHRGDDDGRGSCEPECNDLPRGQHHACCSQRLLEEERMNNLV